MDGDPRDQPPPPAPAKPRSRARDLWQLDIPLVFGLALCTFLTIVEARRAGEGFWRAWVYTLEWPIIGAFIIWIWWRYKHEGQLTKGTVRRWRQRVDPYEREARNADASDDPGLAAWRQQVAELEREPGKDT